MARGRARLRASLPRSRRGRLVAALVVLAVVVGVGVAVTALRGDDRTRFEAAVALAPSSSSRFTWTDWAAVRREVGAKLSARSTARELDDFSSTLFDRDLAQGSALQGSAATTQERFRFSPATIDWELFAQGADGAVVIMGLPDGFDTDALRQRLTSVGFQRPKADDGVWRGGVDLLARLGTVTPELANLRIDDERGLLLGSDSAAYLARDANRARGDRQDGVSDVVAATGGAISASAFTGAYTCAELAMSQADPADRTRAGELIEDAGGVHPLTAYAVAGLPGGKVRFALGLEDERRARDDADSRSRLAAGPAPGQGGSFGDVFTLDRAAAKGRVVTLDVTPRDGAFVLSDLDHGPVLFASC